MKKTNPKLNCNPLILLLALLLLAGCGRSVPINYYQLAPVLGEEPAGKTPPIENLAIGIGPVRLEEHLARPQLITRTGPARLQLADRHRWAEPLADNIAWVVRDNLAALLGTEHLLLYPWEKTTPLTHQVRLEVLRCEGGEDGSAQLTVLWSVTDGQGKELQPPRRGNYKAIPVTPDEAGLVSALSESLAHFSRDLAKELLTAGRRP